MYEHTATRPQTSNRILNALTRPEFVSLSAHLDPVYLSPREILYRPGQPVTHVYFPNRARSRSSPRSRTAARSRSGMVGNEGMFGVNVFPGSVSTPLLAQVQFAGDALRMPAGVLMKEFGKCGQLQDLLLRYTQAFITPE